jgi:hypothetical protein
MECPATISAPTIVMPEMAFAPDIKGVCRVGGTLAISSKPIKQARTKIKSENMRVVITISLLVVIG